MSDQDPQHPSQQPPIGVPPVQGGAAPPVPYAAPPVPYATPPVTAGVAAPRRSRAWIGWTIGIIVALALLIGSCTVPFALMMGGETSSLPRGIGDAVAVIHIDGPIAGVGDAYSGYVTPERFYDTIDRAQEDSSVKAIVLRVDSPGGTVAASEEIARYVDQCTKPVVVSSGDVNASGAYMVSSQADEIWALPGTAVGSIGVIAQIPNVAGLLDKLGVEFTVITAGENKDTGSPYRPLTDEEKALIQGEVDDVYGQFIDIVAEGREMERSEVESLATGWTWSGERAKELGLVDKIGTYEDALDAAADKGGIRGEYEVTTYDDEFGDIFGALMGLTRVLSSLEAAASGPDTSTRGRLPR
ncbi:MAG: signal peptide peptidase SppA [Coriobacteriia bacterium]|nr:signal peptide peptidase SppA [Coriobacteriia bacterium]